MWITEGKPKKKVHTLNSEFAKDWQLKRKYKDEFFYWKWNSWSLLSNFRYLRIYQYRKNKGGGKAVKQDILDKVFVKLYEK